MKNKISVIIPVYNAEKTIVSTLESVRNQTWKGDFEIIIINDGSTDNSRKLIENYIAERTEMNILLLNQENKGVSAARNSGMKNATADFIALLDSDDEWLPAKTEIQLNYFETQPEIDFLASARNNQKLLFPYNSKENPVEVKFWKLLIRNEITVPSVIFKRKILDNTGFFQEGQNHAEDVDFYLRISKNNKMYILKESLVIAGGGKRSFGFSGLSADLKKMAEGYQHNFSRLHKSGRINFFELIGLRLFYHLKYLVLLMRNSFH